MPNQEAPSYLNIPLRDEKEGAQELKNLETKTNDIFSFLNSNWDKISESLDDMNALEASNIEKDLTFVRDNILRLNALLKKHEKDIKISTNHLEDRLGKFLSGGCATLKRLIEGRPLSKELYAVMKKNITAFSQYLKTIIEHEGFLVEEISSYEGQSLH